MQLSLEDKFDALDSEEARMGFINGLKGKLFEIKYTDYLNGGVLPSGYEAHRFTDPTHVGSDIYITGPDNAITEELQLKATESTDYIQAALDKYPDIPVVSTEEVFAHAMFHDANMVQDSGISSIDLTNTVTMNIDPGITDIDIFPGVFSAIFLTAVTCVTQKDKTTTQKGIYIGNKYIHMVPGHVLGSAIGLTVGGPGGLAVGVTVSAAVNCWLNSKENKAMQLHRLHKQVKINARAINQLKAMYSC